ncbi:SAM-dependent methyltransferase [Flammeovirga sp. MY04]|uniref:SAM-dependent methyltransferase n=1 Tax=Flammeovirga sp. MY04 TaxID=1191459 RepID=UPI00080636F5|nr:SAM-dependent methyltransferase [Flammeovirga sp. MY04]ANQ47744.1 SAM-dependent methyltransferase [Flammeovirga sp. MY04]
MTFKLNTTVPWGRTLEEYVKMFSLSDTDLDKKLIGFGDGPASFNQEMTSNGKSVVSLDPIYQFSENEIRERIEETRDIVLEQTKNNQEKFVWSTIKDLDDLEDIRMDAMNTFLEDFEEGKSDRRYISHELPAKTYFLDKDFDIALSSHFLLLYSDLGLDFHIQAIDEMLRVAEEVRIFPIVNLNGERTELLDDIIKNYAGKNMVLLQKVEYEFQKGANEMLVIK